MKQVLTFTSIFLFIFSCHVYAGDVAAGKEKSALCAACHGTDGNSVNPVWPKLAGQHSEYILKQLKDFKAGKRNNIQMNPLVATLSEEDMQDLAAYFSSQQAKIGYASAESLEMGEKIYRAGDASKGLAACMSCHGPTGAGNPAASFPSLSGQHAEYTKIQLLAFRDNKRTNDTNNAMQIVSEKMTTDEIDAVVNYIQGLH
jgi:cytochrome c553